MLGAFSKQVAVCFSRSFTTKCLAIREGLLFANENSFCVSLVETDGLNATCAINRTRSFAVVDSIIKDIEVSYVRSWR